MKDADFAATTIAIMLKMLLERHTKAQIKKMLAPKTLSEALKILSGEGQSKKSIHEYPESVDNVT